MVTTVTGEQPLGRRFLLASAVFALAAGALFGWCTPWFVARHGQLPLDLVGLHLPATTHALLETYGPLGRRDYLLFLILDVPFPLAGTWMTITGVRFFAARLGVQGWRATAPAAAAVGASIADILENVGYAVQSIQHSPGLSWIAWPRFAASFLKYTCLTVSQAGLGLFFACWLWSRLRSRAAEASPRT